MNVCPNCHADSENFRELDIRDGIEWYACPACGAEFPLHCPDCGDVAYYTDETSYQHTSPARRVTGCFLIDSTSDPLPEEYAGAAAALVVLARLRGDTKSAADVVRLVEANRDEWRLHVEPVAAGDVVASWRSTGDSWVRVTLGADAEVTVHAFDVHEHAWKIDLDHRTPLAVVRQTLDTAITTHHDSEEE